MNHPLSLSDVLLNGVTIGFTEVLATHPLNLWRLRSQVYTKEPFRPFRGAGKDITL